MRDAGSATLNWKEKAGQYTIVLFGPMNAYQLVLRGNKKEVKLRINNNQEIKADSAEALALQTLGYPLPISHLRYWIRALPVPGTPASYHFTQNQELNELEQDGWKILYLEYMNKDGYNLPRKIRLEKEGLSLKIFIDHW